MPAVMEQVNMMSADEKLRLIVHIAESLSVGSPRQDSSAVSVLETRKKPCVRDFIGYGRRFHPEYRSTEDVMRELREGGIDNSALSAQMDLTLFVYTRRPPITEVRLAGADLCYNSPVKRTRVREAIVL